AAGGAGVPPAWLERTVSRARSGRRTGPAPTTSSSASRTSVRERRRITRGKIDGGAAGSGWPGDRLTVRLTPPSGCAIGPSGRGTVDSVRIATWNVNSIKQRVPRLLPWLDERRPDVVCLQETKLADDAFTELLGTELAERGYETALHGEPAWNGVAILSRVGLEDVVAGVAGGPGFPHQEARAVAATCAGIRVVSVYVPNGRVPESEHYRYKLEWLAALKQVL